MPAHICSLPAAVCRNNSYETLLAVEPAPAPAPAPEPAAISEGVPPQQTAAKAAWTAEATAMLDARVKEHRCAWDKLPDDDLLDVLDEFEALGKTEDQVSSQAICRDSW